MAPIVRRWLGPLVALAGVWESAVLAGGPRLLPLPFTRQTDVLEKSVAAFNGLLVEELKSHPELTLLAPVKNGQVSMHLSKDPAAEALSAMGRGRAAMAALDFRKAVVELSQAIALYLGDAATADFDAVDEAYLQIAVASYRLGQEKDAERALGNLFRLHSAIQLPAKKYPPPFLQLADRVRSRIDRGNHGSVTIDGPAGARAFVDGRLAGNTPIRAEFLPEGSHSVRVEGAQGELFGQAVEVRGDVAVKAVFLTAGDVAVLTAAPPLSQALLDAAYEQHLRAYCQAAGVDFALVGVMFHSDDHRLIVAGALYSASLGAFSLLEPRAMDELMKGANVEAFRLAENAAVATRAFGQPATLPVSLLAAQPPTHELPIETAQGDPVAREQSRPRLIPDGPPVGLPAQTLPPQAPGRAPQTPDEWASGVPWWGWTLIGVGAGLLVGGGAFAVWQVTHPGQVIAQW